MKSPLAEEMNTFLSEGAMHPIQKLNELFAWIIFNTKIGKVKFSELKSVLYKYIIIAMLILVH